MNEKFVNRTLQVIKIVSRIFRQRQQFISLRLLCAVNKIDSFMHGLSGSGLLSHSSTLIAGNSGWCYAVTINGACFRKRAQCHIVLHYCVCEVFLMFLRTVLLCLCYILLNAVFACMIVNASTS